MFGVCVGEYGLSVVGVVLVVFVEIIGCWS